MAAPISHPDIPTLSFDTTDRGFVADPWPRYAQIAELGGVVFNEHINRVMVSGFYDTRQILTTPTQFGSEKGQHEHAAVFGGPTMEFYDGDHHDRMRAIWSDDFRPKTLAALRPMITDVVRARLRPALEKLRDGESIEAISELTRAIPTEVIARMLGVQPEMVGQFSTWSDAMGAAAEGYSSPGEHGAELIRAGKQATAELNDYLRTQIADRRCPSTHSDDLISTMVRHDYACAHMTEEEIVASNTQLVFAGNETTAKLLGHFLVTLAAHPDQLAALRADPTLIPAAIEEVHRFETISHSIFRDALGDHTTVGEHRIPADMRITLLLAAANRDPRRWDDPHRFDIHRKKLPHLGFAFGSHSCLGMNLARLEAWVFAEELIDALPQWQVRTPVDYGSNYTVRGPQEVILFAVYASKYGSTG